MKGRGRRGAATTPPARGSPQELAPHALRPQFAELRFYRAQLFALALGLAGLGRREPLLEISNGGAGVHQVIGGGGGPVVRQQLHATRSRRA
jgi:hypothetical protein